MRYERRFKTVYDTQEKIVICMAIDNEHAQLICNALNQMKEES